MNDANERWFDALRELIDREDFHGGGVRIDIDPQGNIRGMRQQDTKVLPKGPQPITEQREGVG